MQARFRTFELSSNFLSKYWVQFALGVLLLFLSLVNANAQLNLQIGGSEAEFKATLAQAGYNRIDTVKIGLSSSKFDACQGGKRYRIEFKWTGQASRKIIGDCRIAIDQQAVRKLLRDRGFSRINIEDRAGKFLALGCRQSERFRIEVNYFGDIEKERRIGSCQEELSPADITAKLEESGYDRVNFIDRRLPVYVAEACQDRNRVELKINRFGEIAESRRIGACRSSINANELTALMEEKGYTRVKLIDGKLPRYIAHGCKAGNRMEVTLNRWGEISDEFMIGKCRNAYSQDEISASMRDNGYTNVSVTLDSGNYRTRGCKDNRLDEIILTRFGELVDRKDLGSCDAPRINDLAETLRERGLSKLQFYVEACRGKRKVRISFDEFANRTGREVIGNC
ncbi:MAG: hypothetical protein WBC71_08150 [Salaquimonas sp.]